MIWSPFNQLSGSAQQQVEEQHLYTTICVYDQRKPSAT